MPTRAEIIHRIRQQLLISGMTTEQMRARLYEAGYPATLFDAYLPGFTGTRPIPTDEVYLAIQELGIADSSEVAYFRRLPADTLPRLARDSLSVSPRRDVASRPRDTLSRGGDTLMVRDTTARGITPRIVVRADIADSLARLDSGYNIFGLEIFRTATNFEPSLLGPVDQNYRLGPGDQLVLILSGDVEGSHTLEVNREGFIVIPQVGPVFVANLTLGQLEDLLFSRLGRVYSGVRRSPGATTRFSVSVSRLRTNQVFVLGDVERPGSYMVSSAGTAMAALYAAGGPTANGSLRNVLVRRGDRLVTTVDLYDYLLRGDASRDARLETGDIVFVPPRSLRVRVLGEVIRPATYELKAGETLADLLIAAGGLRAEASRQRVQIERIVPPTQRVANGRDRLTIDFHSDDLGNGGVDRIPIEAGDVVRVFPVATRVRNTVTVKGNVWSPGPLGLEAGMTIADAIRRAGGPKPDVYLGQVLVTRLTSDSSRFQMRASFRDSLGSITNDFPLVEDDLIEVFSVADFRPDRYVAIGGAVRKPGRYEYRQGMTVRDLVLLADGLQESAYLADAEIARLPADRNGATTATTIRVPLDSSYVFARGPGQPYFGVPGIQASADGAPEVELKPYDNVLIKEQPNWELQRVVTITGEVSFPGPYALKTRGDRLSDLVERAGGFTSEAYPAGTIFIRRKGRVGRVAIDVPTAIRRKRSPENMLLADGDHITVPQRSFVVTVQGAVNAPNVVAHVPGKGIDYYVRQAGGAARNGDKGAVFVTQPSGKRETKRRFIEPEPLAGSIVHVPEIDPAARISFLQTLANLTPVITSVITTYLLIRQL